MHIVADHERVIVGLGDFVAQPGDVRERRAEKTGADPTRIVQHPAQFGIAAGLEKVRVEAQNAALGGISEKEIDVGEQERGDVFRGDDIIRDVGHHDPAEAGLENEIGRVVVYQNEAATCTVRIEGESIVTPGGVRSAWTRCRLPDVHRERWFRGRHQQGMPVGFHFVEVLGALDGVGKLRRVRAA